MESTPLLDCAGRRRSPATTSSFHEGLPPRNKGLRYPPDPPTVEEIVAVMRIAVNSADGVRLRGIIVVLWRAGLRISEALALNETDLDPDRCSLLVRHGKGTNAERSGWTGGRGRNSRRGWRLGEGCRSVGCSALCVARRPGVLALLPGSALNCVTLRQRLVSGVGSLRTSSGTLTRSRCRAKGSR